MSKKLRERIHTVSGSGNTKSHLQERDGQGRFGVISANKIDKADRRDFGKAKSRLLSIKRKLNRLKSFNQKCR